MIFNIEGLKPFSSGDITKISFYRKNNGLNYEAIYKKFPDMDIKTIKYIVKHYAEDNDSITVEDIESYFDDEELDVFLKFEDTWNDRFRIISKTMGRDIEYLNKIYNTLVRRKKDLTKLGILNEEIDRLHYAGMNEMEIALYKNISPAYVINYVSNNLGPKQKVDLYPVNTYKVERFKNFQCEVGDKFKIEHFSKIESCLITDTVTVLEKYPFVAATDKGEFTYTDLFLAQRIR